MKYIIVPGAWGLKPFHPYYQWWCGCSWIDWMRTWGFEQPNDLDPFIWSTDLTMEAYRAGGAALKWYVWGAIRTDEPVRIIAHSMGWQVVLWAAAHGLQIDVAISLGSPQRQDMADVFVMARPSIRRWIHVQSAELDIFDWLGNLGDVELDYRNVTGYDRLDRVPGIGHSRVIFDPAWFVLWETRGWLNELRADWA